MNWQPRNDWHRHGDLYWRGYAFAGARAIDFSTVNPGVFTNENAALLWLRSLNGCFALVYAPNGRVRVGAVDGGRTIPLFCDTRTGNLLDRVTPADLEVRNLAWLGRNWWHDLEFLPGSHTLDPKIRSLEPRQLLWSDAGGTRLLTYAEPLRQYPDIQSEVAAARLFKETLFSALERTIELAAGRPLVVLLSGGFDSRLLLVGLRTLGYRNLHALTYGLPDSDEYRRARAITETTGVAHHFVDYRRPDLAPYLSAHLAEYTRYAANAQSVPQEQEWPAMYAARHIDSIAEGIFLPGLGGDTFGGAPVPQHYLRLPGRLSTAGVRDWMIHRYSRFDLARGGSLLAEYLPQGPFSDEAAAIETIRDWLVRERLAKYMFNGLRSYEYEGRDWYLPLFDRALREFWCSVPISMLRRRLAYRRWAAEGVFAPAGALLPDEPLPPAPLWRSEWVPPGWKPKKVAQRDPNGLHELLLPAITAAIGRFDGERTINEWMGRYTSSLYRQ